MESYTQNSTNDLIMNNSAYINDIENVNYKIQSNVYDMRLSYLENKSKSYTSAFASFSKGVKNYQQLQESSLSVSLSGKVQSVIHDIELQQKKYGILSEEEQASYKAIKDKLVEGYQGKITNSRLLSIAILPLENKLSGLKNDEARFKVKSNLDATLSPYRPIGDEEQFKQAYEDRTNPANVEIGKHIYGEAGWNERVMRSEEANISSLLQNTHTVNKTETAQLMNRLKPYMSKATFDRIVHDLGSVYDAQEYLKNNQGVGIPANESLREQEAKTVAVIKNDIRKNNGNVKVEDVIGLIPKESAGAGMRILALTKMSLEADGLGYIVKNFEEANPAFKVAMTYIGYGKFGNENYQNLTGYPLINSTESIKLIEDLSDSLTISRDNPAQNIISDIGSFVINSFYSIAGNKQGSNNLGIVGHNISATGGLNNILGSAFNFYMTMDNWADIMLTLDKNFNQYRIDNRSLIVADGIKAYSLGQLDITRSPDGKFAAGTQNSLINIQHKRFMGDGSFSDVARDNVINAAKKGLKEYIKTDEKAFNKAFGSSSIYENTYATTLTLLTLAYGSKGFSIKSQNGNTYVTTEGHTYNLNQKEDAELMFRNVFKTLDTNATVGKK